MDEEQEVLIDAQRERDKQVAEQGASSYEPDPAIQDAIDHAKATAADGPEPGSEAPGLMGLGGLSRAEIDAQQQEIAERQSAVEVPERTESPAVTLPDPVPEA
jgi:hypothetical protein